MMCQVLNSISRLSSSVTLVGESKHSWEDLVTFVTGPFAVLLHVRNNHHFVLATGLASSPLTFTVHDPMLYTNEFAPPNFVAAPIPPDFLQVPLRQRQRLHHVRLLLATWRRRFAVPAVPDCSHFHFLIIARRYQYSSPGHP